MSESNAPSSKKAFYKRWWFWALAVVVVIIIASSGGDKDLSSTATTASQKTAQAEVTYKLKDEAPAGDLTFVANSITKKKTVGSGYFAKTSQSGTYAIVNVTVKNTGKETITIDSSLFSMFDSQGREFKYSIDGQTAYMTAGKDNFFLKQVQPGLSATGEIIFEIPEDTAGLKLSVRSGVFSSKKAVINLE